MEDSVKALGEVTWDVLQRMVRELLARKPGGHLVEANLRHLDLQMPLALTGPDADPQVFSEKLAEILDSILDDAVQQAAAFRPGHAFCHRCGGSECEHTLPPSSRHVLVGYGPTGTPLWEDFAQYCLDLRHPEVDLLYEDPPAFLALQQDAATLHGNILDAFETRSFELLGQIAAGFFPIRARQEEGRGVLALTFQVAASRSKRNQVRLGLNILGRTPRGEELGMLWERHRDLPWRRSVRWAQSALVSVTAGRRRRGAGGSLPRDALESRVEGILGGMARRLERDVRARARRTRHAETRRLSGDRPTGKAVEDVRSAAREAFLVDEASGTLVVLGDRGRTHFFTPEGRHVSSVRYTRDAIERKRRFGQWREASEEQANRLQSALLGNGG